MPGLTDDDAVALEALMAAQDGDQGAPAETGESDGTGTPAPAEGGEQEHPDGGTPGATPPEPQAGGDGAPAEGEDDGYVDVESLRIGNRDVPIEDVNALLEFQSWANANPDKMQAFNAYVNGQADFVIRQQQQEAQQQAQQAAQTPTPQIDWDLVDPAVKAAYDQQQAQLAAVQQSIESLKNPVEQWQQHQAAEAQRQAVGAIEAATKRVQDKFGFDLTPQEIDDLHRATSQLGILPGLRQRIADPVDAVATALEMTLFQTPEYRDRIVDAQVASKRAEDKRQLASSVAGTSGSDRAGVSSPVGESTPGRKLTPEERQRAMAAEIAEYQRGTP